MKRINLPTRTPSEKYERYKKELCPDCDCDDFLPNDADGIMFCPHCHWSED